MSVLLREAIGGSIRRARTERNRTLRDVSHSARVSLGYLSEIERGRKEPSSELLAAICEALKFPLPDLLDEVADALRPDEAAHQAAAARPARRTRPVAVLDPALRSAVEEALEPVQEEQGSESELADTPAGVDEGAGADDEPVEPASAALVESWVGDAWVGDVVDDSPSEDDAEVDVPAEPAAPTGSPVVVVGLVPLTSPVCVAA